MRTLHARAAASPMTALALLAIFAHATSLGAQQPAAAAHISRDSLDKALNALRASSDSAWLPPSPAFSLGDRTIAAKSHVSGPVAIADGALHVRGEIDGDAVAYAGDIIVHQGGEIRGNAYAILGKVLLDGGTVRGETRTLAGDLRRVDALPAAQVRTAASATLHSLALAGGWLAVLVVVGIGVLIFASTNLDAVSDALERGFGRSLLAGIAAQLALAPVLALLCVALTLTVLGILLIPFAVVAYVLAAAGLVTLGYLAIARLVGRTVLGANEPGDGARRAAALRGLVYGLLLLMIPWLVAGALAWSPTGEALVRIVAVGVTWVTATAGLGAAVVSRGGVKRATAPAAQRALSAASWSTPTPISGVTAARRPTPFSAPAPK